MPKRTLEMSAQAVARLRDDGDHHVGGVPGLLLRIKGATRHWCLRYVLHGKRRLMGLGAFPAVPLSQARELGRAARAQVAAGVDPIDARAALARAAREAARDAMTFDMAAEQYIAARESEWKNAKHRSQWVNTLAQYASPVIGRMNVAQIEQTHILRVLDPIWRTKTETATRVRGRIESVLDWCAVKGRRSGPNPARWRGHLEELLPDPKKIAQVQHHRAVPWGDAPATYARIALMPGTGALALRFLALTVPRSTELREACWDEFDMNERVWTIPSSRMKVEKNGDHRIPLSRQAVALLNNLPRFEGERLVFPGTKPGAPLSNKTMAAVMDRLHIDAVPHGWRSTFRDWAAECTDFAGEVAEKALAHAVRSGVEAAYRRGDLFAKRRLLMQAWADYLDPPSLLAG